MDAPYTTIEAVAPGTIGLLSCLGMDDTPRLRRALQEQGFWWIEVRRPDRCDILYGPQSLGPDAFRLVDAALLAPHNSHPREGEHLSGPPSDDADQTPAPVVLRVQSPVFDKTALEWSRMVAKEAGWAVLEAQSGVLWTEVLPADGRSLDDVKRWLDKHNVAYEMLDGGSRWRVRPRALVPGEELRQSAVGESVVDDLRDEVVPADFAGFRGEHELRDIERALASLVHDKTGGADLTPEERSDLHQLAREIRDEVALGDAKEADSTAPISSKELQSANSGMKRWRIQSSLGTIFADGIEAVTAKGALEKLARDRGYATYDEWCKNIGVEPDAYQVVGGFRIVFGEGVFSGPVRKDLRLDYDDQHRLSDGSTLYRKDNVLQVWYADRSHETWTLPAGTSEEEMKSAFETLIAQWEEEPHGKRMPGEAGEAQARGTLALWTVEFEDGYITQVYARDEEQAKRDGQSERRSYGRDGEDEKDMTQADWLRNTTAVKAWRAQKEAQGQPPLGRKPRRAPSSPRIDLRTKYDDKHLFRNGSTLYRKGNVFQIWYPDYGPETWTLAGEDEEEAESCFADLVDQIDVEDVEPLDDVHRRFQLVIDQEHTARALRLLRELEVGHQKYGNVTLLWFPDVETFHQAKDDLHKASINTDIPEASEDRELDDLVQDIYTRFRAHRDIDDLDLSRRQRMALKWIRDEVAYDRGSAEKMKGEIRQVLLDVGEQHGAAEGRASASAIQVAKKEMDQAKVVMKRAEAKMVRVWNTPREEKAREEYGKASDLYQAAATAWQKALGNLPEQAPATHDQCRYYAAIKAREGWGHCSLPSINRDVPADGAVCGEFEPVKAEEDVDEVRPYRPTPRPRRSGSPRPPGVSRLYRSGRRTPRPKRRSAGEGVDEIEQAVDRMLGGEDDGT